MGLYKSEKKQIQQIREAEIIIRAVEDIREDQPRIGVRKLQVKLQETLNKHAIKIGRDGLFDLLGEFNMLVKTRRYKHYTTNSNHQFYKYPNIIKNVEVTRSNQLWVSDITYIDIGSKFSYLFLITDAFSRKIVGYCLSDNYSVEGGIKALRMALGANKVQPGLIHHSDRGVQYCCKEYTALLKKKNAIISMTENSDPYENAIAERVNGILKTELLQSKYESHQQAVKDVNKAILIYNTERPHMSIGLLTPEEAHQREGNIKELWRKKQREHVKIINRLCSLT